MGWQELSDSALVVFPKPGVKTPFKMGLANIFESKSAGVVEKAVASPEFIAGQMGKNFERLDFLDATYGSTPAFRVQIEGLGVGAEPTFVELRPGELYYSRKQPRIEKFLAGEKRTFGTYWTVVAPPDAKSATLERTATKLRDAGFGEGEVWRHPITDATAQRIAEAVLKFVESEGR